ncbi:saccharopine dehydrogenase family protein [Phenylobacterium sp.]|uniref:saccharopine dehydrogenase family protein n=1 Tax=Phenylobacterium sp. TaxID=1871053 RepID=UPI002F424E9E
MSTRALLYGATGYTGRLVARRLAEAGVDVVLAGRNAEGVRRVAEPLGLAWMAFDLTSAGPIEQALASIDVVLHAAGPYDRTAGPMIAACLNTATHYLDLSGEWPSFVDAMASDAEAREAGVMIMPGVGLTIVATDCLLALATQARPDATKLRVGISKAQVITRGSVVTATTLLSPDVVIRRNGALASVPAGSLVHAFDFGEGLSEAVAMSWADVVTGGLTTGVGDIEVYSEMDWSQRAAYRASSMAMAITGARPWRALGGALAAAWPEAPSEERRKQAGFVLVAEAVDPWRRVSRIRMRTRDGYTVSELTAAAAVGRVLAGEAKPGFQTPARVFGADFILGLECAWLDPASAQAEGAAA